MRKRVFALLVSLGAIASTATPSLAIPYGTDTVYKVMDGGYDAVVFSGTPGSKVSVSLGSVDKTVARIAGSCGEVRISPPASGDFTGLKVDGTAIDASQLSVQTLPTCTNGSFSETRSNNFKTASNQVVIVGKTAGSAVAVTLPSAATKSVTINGCGFGLYKANASTPLASSFMVGSTSYTTTSLPNAQIAPYCRTVAGTPYGYIPSSWNP